MKKSIFPLIIFLLPFIIHAQSSATKRINLNSLDSLNSKIVHTDGNQLLLFSTHGNSIIFYKSSNLGGSWSQGQKVIDVDGGNTWDVVKKENSLLLTFKRNDSVIVHRSNDNGNTWFHLSSFKLPEQIKFLRSSLLNDGSLAVYFFTNSSKLIITYSTNNLLGWSQFVQILSSDRYYNANISQLSNGRLIASISRNFPPDIYVSYSDNGFTWSSPSPLLNTNAVEKDPFILNQSDGNARIYFTKSFPTELSEFNQTDICYIETTNNGNTWSLPVKVTTHISNDLLVSGFKVSVDDYVTFLTDRYKGFGYYDVAFKKVAPEAENETIPYFYKLISDYLGKDLSFRIRVVLMNVVNPTRVFVKTLKGERELFDDGTNGDSIANDKIYTNKISINDFPILDFINANAILANVNHYGVPVNFDLISDIEIKIVQNVNQEYLYSRQIKMPYEGHFEDVNFLFSGGFMLSGYHNNYLWANGSFQAPRIRDYVLGKFNSNPNDPKNRVYTVRRSDAPFSKSWQDWRYAVELGAYFYDGDGDGRYNPIDKNENGLWDVDEDMPDILGDVTIFATINDGVPASERRYKDVNPLGIEVRLTIFASNKNQSLNNTIFARYSILNTGSVADVLDSVIFSFVTDFDVGEYSDDLGGCDTTLNASFAYHNNPDPKFGPTIPAAFQVILQKPWYYTGNQNDKAYNFMGKILGVKKFLGYKHADLNSYFRAYGCMSDLNRDPYNRFVARYFMTGRLANGKLINPCSYNGMVFGPINCAQVNPVFVYSGNPSTRIGWLDTTKWDLISYLNVGPFKLEAGKPVDIIVAHVVARPENSINAIDNGKQIIQNIVNEYQSNFPTLTSIDENIIAKPPVNFVVYQNYPNPFNSITKIRYSIPEKGKVKIDLYDILGRKIETLVDAEKEIGDYLYLLDASKFGLSSGIYFYEIGYKSYQVIKKMVYVK